MTDQSCAGASEYLDFSQTLRAVAAGKHDQRDDRRGGDRRRGVHSHGDFEGQGWHKRSFSLIVDAGFELGRLDQFLDGQSLAET